MAPFVRVCMKKAPDWVLKSSGRGKASRIESGRTKITAPTPMEIRAAKIAFGTAGEFTLCEEAEAFFHKASLLLAHHLMQYAFRLQRFRRI